MTSKVEEVVAQVLSWPPESRAFLASKLLESLDAEEDFSVSEAWQNEVRRRAAAVDAGEATLRPMEEVFARLDSDLNERRLD